MGGDMNKEESVSVDDLINAALSEAGEEAAWDAVCALQWRGSREVLKRAEALCTSDCSRERRLGADILGQLGLPERTFPVECSRLLRNLLKVEKEAEVIQATLIGLSFQHDAEAVPLVVRFSTHPDPKVRHAVVLALSGQEKPLAIECLISLSRDADSYVRDWATFALGTQTELNTPEIREALVDRLDDLDDDARGEALVGLARRNDRRVVDSLTKELSSDCVGTLAIEAAELIASPELHPHLVDLREWWDVDPELLERAISASQA
jgi:HEAT repeat protein